jgi:hypothetical protein
VKRAISTCRHCWQALIAFHRLPVGTGQRELSLMDLTNPKIIYLKGFLFLLAGLIASAAILIEIPTLKIALLLAIAIWSFSRAYYFAFYVIQRYVDPTYRFAGLWSFVKYMIRKRSTN